MIVCCVIVLIFIKSFLLQTMAAMSSTLKIFISFITLFGFSQSSDSEICLDRKLYAQDQERGHDAMVQHAEYNVITKTVILNQGTSNEARSNIRQYFKDTFDLDSSLFDHIKPQVLSQSMHSNYTIIKIHPYAHT